MTSTPPSCRCHAPPFAHTDYESRAVGVDPTQGRDADVEVERCRHCGQHWLRYHYEWPHYSRSGRWYRVAIPAEEADGLTVESALAALARTPWHFRGGSFFDTTGVRSQAPLDPNRL